MKQKRILLVCYYFPPLGGAGVGRPLMLYKYLSGYGYDCDVLTVKPVAYRIYEPELLNGLDTGCIYRSRSWDPQRLMYLLGLRKIKDAAISKGKKISDSFFPDSKIGWIKPAVKLGRVLAENRHYRCVISTSPPISTHLIAKKLSSEFNLPWIADFRDFWTLYKAENWYENDKQVKKALALLKEITTKATTVTVVNPAIAEYLKTGIIIYNSYDEQRKHFWTKPLDSNVFNIGILGTIDKMRPVEPLFKLLTLLKEKAPELFKAIRLLQVGDINTYDFYHLLEQYHLQDKCIVYQHQKRDDTIKIISETSMLYISLASPEGNGVLPVRIFDMLVSGRPIIAAVPQGSVVENIVKETNNGFCYEESSINEAADYLIKRIELFNQKKLDIEIEPSYAKRFSSSKMVENFVNVIEDIY